ncbi:hypothetical protein [Pseudomonas sp. BBP2017]|uniref:hypothetical protein n=1 Tax=Pseudomonas sp. BBP2017 TaxID=2109731 RepID=UPI0021153CD2|nr:hypothetical protein [Pseudomonas sp. BBP2017]
MRFVNKRMITLWGIHDEPDARSPQRMELFDLQCQYAKDQGVLISINSDAHRSAEFSNLRYGVAQARRAWLESQNVLNTRSLSELKY